ncbi:Protein turtle A [Bulinus truncatus]|nr:Protein turtle A [Bulinus truncatus]
MTDGQGVVVSEMTGNKQLFRSASLGGQQVLPCEIVYPPEYPEVQYVVTWTKQGLNGSLLIKIEGYNTPLVQEEYKDRIDILNKEASLKISHIEKDDEGWYGCEVYFTGLDNHEKKKSPSSTSWVYLTVHCIVLHKMVQWFDKAGIVLHKMVQWFDKAGIVLQKMVQWFDKAGIVLHKMVGSDSRICSCDRWDQIAGSVPVTGGIREQWICSCDRWDQRAGSVPVTGGIRELDMSL